MEAVDSAEVVLYEVGPRDGLQNETTEVATQAKLDLIRGLAGAGLRHIEATAFVSPRWIPQLADAERLAERLPEREGLRYSALVPNLQGYARFRASGRLAVAAVFVSASESHNRRNLNCSVGEQLERIRPVAEACHADGVPVRAYVSTACGCPYEGRIAPDDVVDLCRRLMALGADEISLGDTSGVGHPRQVRELVAAVAAELPLDRLALHLHDTHGRALANVQAGFEAGVRIFDSALAGLGGCPSAPGAAGNVATEDVVDLFESADVRTGVDLEALVDVSCWLEREVLGRPLPGRVYRARMGARERAAGPGT